MQVWMANDEYIEAHNGRHPKPSYALGHNQFSDMTFEEYRWHNKLGEHSPGVMMTRSGPPLDYGENARDPVPDYKNWVDDGRLLWYQTN